jgi:hypothetical protein
VFVRGSTEPAYIDCPDHGAPSEIIACEAMSTTAIRTLKRWYGRKIAAEERTRRESSMNSIGQYDRAQSMRDAYEDDDAACDLERMREEEEADRG